MEAVGGCARNTAGRDVALRFLTQVAEASRAHGRFEILLPQDVTDGGP
jgi:hypothetical protein